MTSIGTFYYLMDLWKMKFVTRKYESVYSQMVHRWVAALLFIQSNEVLGSFFLIFLRCKRYVFICAVYSCSQAIFGFGWRNHWPNCVFLPCYTREVNVFSSLCFEILFQTEADGCDVCLCKHGSSRYELSMQKWNESIIHFSIVSWASPVQNDRRLDFVYNSEQFSTFWAQFLIFRLVR